MPLCLGLDLGTTKTAAVLVDAETHNLLAATSRVTGADLYPETGNSEQDPARILRTLERCIGELPFELKKKVSAIGVTGQMHGVLLWNPGAASTSSLITWQDQRCNDGGFIEDLQKNTGEKSIKTGFGCASLAWLRCNNVPLLENHANASTVQDYLVALLCDLDHAVTDPTNAASWGFFDIRQLEWNRQKTSIAGIPLNLLPEVLQTGSVAGRLSNEYSLRWGLREGIPVTTAIGDNQASLFSTLENPCSQIALTLGTGGQLSTIVASLDESSGGPTFEYRPYVDGMYAAVAASLCGGSAFTWLAETVSEWMQAMGVTPPSRDAVYARLTALGLDSFKSELTVEPHFLGERHNSALRGHISGIDLNNFTLGSLASALTRGIVENLRRMLPEHLLKGRTEVVGSGNAIRRSKLMQKTIEELFGLPLRISGGQEEAACGAALLAARNLS